MARKTRHRQSSSTRGGDASTGDAALEYALVAAAIAMALGFAVWMTGPEIHGRLQTIQASIDDADPVITTSIDKSQPSRPRPLAGWAEDEARTRGTVGPASE